MAMYVAKEDTQVNSALSPLISLWPRGFCGARPGGSAASLSDRAILSGSSSLMSTNSRAWILFTNLAGTGTILFAILNGDVLDFGSAPVSPVPGKTELANKGGP